MFRLLPLGLRRCGYRGKEEEFCRNSKFAFILRSSKRACQVNGEDTYIIVRLINAGYLLLD